MEASQAVMDLLAVAFAAGNDAKVSVWSVTFVGRLSVKRVNARMAEQTDDQSDWVRLSKA